MKMNRKLCIALATLLLFGMLAGCKKKEDLAIAELKAQTTTEDGFMMTGTVLTGYSGTNTNIIIPDSVTSIRFGAFSGCTSLASITIPDSVTIIGGGYNSGAFQNCTSLTSVTIGNGVTSIEDFAFSGCTSLASITIPDSVTSIGFGAFSGSGITNVTIPNSVTRIEGFSYENGGAFSNCINLTNVTIPNSVTKIGENAFSGCTSLASVTIPNSVQEIWADAFGGCASLASVTFQGTIAANNLGSSGMDHVNPPSPFYGDLKEKYLAEGIGTYTTTEPVNKNSKWTKQ